MITASKKTFSISVFEGFFFQATVKFFKLFHPLLLFLCQRRNPTRYSHWSVPRKGSSTNQKVDVSIPGSSSRPCAEVSLGHTLHPKLPLMAVYEWCGMETVLCKALYECAYWMVDKTREVLYKYSPFIIHWSTNLWWLHLTWLIVLLYTWNSVPISQLHLSHSYSC